MQPAMTIMNSIETEDREYIILGIAGHNPRSRTNVYEIPIACFNIIKI